MSTWRLPSSRSSQSLQWMQVRYLGDGQVFWSDSLDLWLLTKFMLSGDVLTMSVVACYFLLAPTLFAIWEWPELTQEFTIGVHMLPHISTKTLLQSILSFH